MACYRPLQVYFAEDKFGKKKTHFDPVNTFRFMNGESLSDYRDGVCSIPCGRCMGCRLERSRQWATRLMHESSLYEDNSFVTLTFDDGHLDRMCPDGSLNRKHMQNFMKRVRQEFSDRKIRAFYCGEYGEKSLRPHYHVCLFNLDFVDKVFWKTVNDCNYYTSDSLSKVWRYGHSVVGDLTFESAAYVARYCTKKVTGDLAESHYGGRLPEFAQASLKPGIGHAWIEKYGDSDVFSFDEVVVRGVKCKPPRYYDKVLMRKDPARYDEIKQLREERALTKVDDNTFRRLLVKEKCQEARFKKLIRTLDRS